MTNIKDYQREGKLPHIWCPGCGDGTLSAALVRAIDSLGYNKDDVIIFTGIGCSSRVNNIMDFNSVQTTHGRAVAVATGFQIARPDMKVICVLGDGDGTGIGGNHLIHAARRNMDMTVIIANNSIFGMTGGQFSPLTPNGKFGTTAPYGNSEYPFDACAMMAAAGASYVAKSTVYHVKLTEQLIAEALEHKGFSYVEVITQCPTCYGKRNKPADPYEMLMWQKNNSVTVKQAESMGEEELQGKFIIGKLYERESRPCFTDAYEQVKAKAREAASHEN